MCVAFKGRVESASLKAQPVNTRSGLPASRLGLRLCVYCGKQADSKDHAPPQCLMLPPLPTNLITLPACKSCNNGFSFDENVVRVFLSQIGAHSRLVEERLPGGWLDKTLERSPRIRAIFEASKQSDGNFAFTEQLVGSFRRVFVKACQGLFYGLYDTLVSKDELSLLQVEDQRLINPEEVITKLRPNPLIDITDQPVSEVSPHSWHTREPVYIMKLVDPATGKEFERAFRLVRDTPVDGSVSSQIHLARRS